MKYQLRIDAPRWQWHELLDLLQARGGRKLDGDVQRGRTLLRAEVDLSRAFDRQAQVYASTDGAAHVLSWLQGYRPASRAPDVASPAAGIGEGSPA